MSVLEIKMIPNGPLEMKGNFKIIRPDGKEEEKKRNNSPLPLRPFQ